MYLAEISLALISTLLTYTLINKYRVCSIKASSGTTLILCLIISLFFPNGSTYFQIIFGGSFIGMSISSKFNYLEITIASFLFLPILAKLLIIFPRIGGAIGLSSFMALLIVYFFSKVLLRFRRLKGKQK